MLGPQGFDTDALQALGGCALLPWFLALSRVPKHGFGIAPTYKYNLTNGPPRTAASVP